MAIKEKDETVKAEQPKEKRVKIKLFKDSYKYKDDVVVGVNGVIYKIQRGVEVEVPEAVAEIIEQSIAQDNATADLISRESSKSKGAAALI